MLWFSHSIFPISAHTHQILITLFPLNVVCLWDNSWVGERLSQFARLGIDTLVGRRSASSQITTV